MIINQLVITKNDGGSYSLIGMTANETILNERVAPAEALHYINEGLGMLRPYESKDRTKWQLPRITPTSLPMKQQPREILITDEMKEIMFGKGHPAKNKIMKPKTKTKKLKEKKANDKKKP